MLSKIKRYLLTKKELSGMPGLNSFLGKMDLTALVPVQPDVLALIQKKHKEYVTTVSSPEMAVSLELSLLLYQLAISTQPEVALDLGAGFSSFILRLAAGNSTNFKVYSVDDDENWLQKTISYLKQNNLPTTNVIGMNEFKKLSAVSFGLILLDLNFVEVRKNYIETAINLADKNAVIIFDDTHKIEYLRIVKKETLKNKLSLFNLRNTTLDQFKRFALIGVK